MALDVLADPGRLPVGVLRVPDAILQLSGVLVANGPTWYVAFQGLLGVT
jgi:hypothetical protein